MSPEAEAVRLVCPMCGAPLTDRITIDGSSFLVFGCMFTPRIDAGRSDAELAAQLRTEYADRGGEYFRGQCDRLHLYVTKGEGGRELTGGRPPAQT